jgi:multidrug efflux pump subunit AcrA (membrane-fusion protein)
MFLSQWPKFTATLLVAAATAWGAVSFAQNARVGVQAPQTGDITKGPCDTIDVIEIKPGKFTFIVSVPGSLEASRTQIIASGLKGPAAISWMRSDGDFVSNGDGVCTLDSTGLNDLLVRQRDTTKLAKAAYRNATLARQIAELAQEEFVDGILKQERNDLKSAIDTAQVAAQKAQAQIDRTRDLQKRMEAAMKAKGDQATPADLAAEVDVSERLQVAEQRLEQEKAIMEAVKRRKEVLEKYTSKRIADELAAAVEHKLADESVKKASWQLEVSNETNLQRQITDCSMTSLFAGQIIVEVDPLPSADGEKLTVGSSVIPRQVILRVVADPISVTGLLPDSLIGKVTANQQVDIIVDGTTLRGTVTALGPRLDPDTNDVTYPVRVDIQNRPADLRLTTKVKVYFPTSLPDDVLSVPIAAVLALDGKEHAVGIRSPAGGFEWRPVELGRSNGKSVVITHGLNPGDVVAIDALCLASKLLPF